LLLSLDALSLSDQTYIQQSNSLDELIGSDKLSKEGQALIHSIQIKNTISSNMTIQERITFQKGVRHDLRLRGTIGSVEYGTMIEKDPGEENIIDHQSLYFKKRSTSTNWLMGDHQLSFGYGLITWRSVSPYKSYDALKVLPRFGKGISGYRSSNEYWATRGLAGEWKTNFGNIFLSLGHTPQDGSINDSSVKIDITGQHISESDLDKQNKLMENAATIMWSNGGEKDHIGFIVNTDQTQDDTQKISTTNISIYGKKVWSSWQYFGEVGLLNSENIALINGALFSTKLMKYLISFRHYPRQFRNYRSQPFAEWSGAEDGETGVFQNVIIKYQKHTFAIYQDVVTKNSPEQNNAYDEFKDEYGIRWQWRSKRHGLQLQFRDHSQSNDDIAYISELSKNHEQKQTIKGVYHYKPDNYYDLRWQFITTNYAEHSIGYGLETKCNLRISPTTITLSWIMAQIDDYNSRVYFWDINLPGEMRSLAVSHSGQLIGLRIQMKKTNNYQISFRTRYEWNSLKFLGTPEISTAFSLQINF